MAEEPSWEDIFNPNPTPREPAAAEPVPLVEPPQLYPPTKAFPTTPAPAEGYPPAAQPPAYPTQPTEPDPFAGLFDAAPPAPAAPVPPQPAADPFAELFGTPSPPVQQPPAPQPPLAQQPEPDPFAGLFGTAQPAAEPAPPASTAPRSEPDPFGAFFTTAEPAAAAQPTQPYPAVQQPPAQQDFPRARSLPPLYEDIPQQAAEPAAAAAPADDPFAGLFGTAQSSAPQPQAPVEPVHEYTPEKPFPTTATARFTPREEDDPFAALFGASAAAAPELASGQGASSPGEPISRREARNTADTGLVRGGGSGGGRSGGRGDGGRGDGGGKPRRKRRLLWLKITLPIVLVLAAVGGVGAYGWFNYNEQVRALLGIPLPTDYTGNGNGKEVIVTIHTGDIGEDIAHTLHDKGVTLTFDAFYDLLLEQKEQPAFQPGNFRLQEHMSAKAALKALLDPDNKVTDKLLITEGTTLPDALQTISDTTGIALADLQAAATDLAALGVPTTEHTLEGWLFPATYQLDGGLTAHDVLQLLVDTMIEHLDSAGVPADQRHNVLTLASIIQRESGPNTDDFYKISRVFTNRMEQGINLESDATVAYGTGHLNTVYTTDEERADPSNPYNTYANPGYPVGPIGLPGDLAIDAALHPADGPWLFFVPINLQTGETVFSETADEHEAAVEQLHEWCDASPENDSYCQ